MGKVRDQVINLLGPNLCLFTGMTGVIGISRNFIGV